VPGMIEIRDEHNCPVLTKMAQKGVCLGVKTYMLLPRCCTLVCGSVNIRETNAQFARKAVNPLLEYCQVIRFRALIERQVIIKPLTRFGEIAQAKLHPAVGELVIQRIQPVLPGQLQVVVIEQGSVEIEEDSLDGHFLPFR